MSTTKSEKASQWVANWLDSVADGSSTMSQRKLSSIEKRGGGIAVVKAAAKKRGVHLILLEDDKGNELVAASTKPFKVLSNHAMQRTAGRSAFPLSMTSTFNQQRRALSPAVADLVLVRC
jgi:hypothetical protein